MSVAEGDVEGDAVVHSPESSLHPQNAVQLVWVMDRIIRAKRHWLMGSTTFDGRLEFWANVASKEIGPAHRATRDTPLEALTDAAIEAGVL